ncbi:hypothetical protein SE16_08335 [Ardenticatena maritima]|uniref:Uncharacterized protein n=1 Tax=Ardenticatena maritima TaxID=872965 RepID=A0A0P6XT87_9CHLR|nr:hypothetical protein SE16_08335 [Ardenticatena maritima]
MLVLQAVVLFAVPIFIVNNRLPLLLSIALLCSRIFVHRKPTSRLCHLVRKDDIEADTLLPNTDFTRVVIHIQALPGEIVSPLIYPLKQPERERGGQLLAQVVTKKSNEAMR